MNITKLAKSSNTNMTKPIKKITTRQLTRYGACHRQKILFRKTFGAEAALTTTNLRKALKAGIAVGWAEKLLSNDAYGNYYEAEVNLPERKELDRLRNAQQKEKNTIWGVFRRTECRCNYGGDAYNRACTRRNASIIVLEDKYRKSLSEAYEAYKQAQGKLLLKFLRKE